VNELLLFARLDARRLALETTRVRLDLLVESILPEDERVTFGGEASEVLADPGLVEVAVGNIVENALKHGCTDGSPPRVTVSVGAGRVVVEDEGPGFDRELLASVKEAFVASRQSAGVGLGMALATMIAELHGGRLDVENRKGGGSRVVFDLSSADVRKISGKPL
jgi:signal transduction histidine kinase